MPKNIVLFGATGSIGTSVLNVFEKTNNEFCLKGITCDQNTDSLIDISNRPISEVLQRSSLSFLIAPKYSFKFRPNIKHI